MNTKTRESKKAKRQRPSLLDEVLERRMLLYVLAAGAVLAGASGMAQAKVVFTPSTAVLTNSDCWFHPAVSSLAIDLNNDGTIDFTLNDYCISVFHSGTERRRPPLGTFYNYYILSAKGAETSNVIEQSADGLAALTNGANHWIWRNFQRRWIYGGGQRW